MRGEFNGLQALFREECPSAYYVHCFAHRLQLTLNAAAKGVHDIWEFFSTLNFIVNFVDSSTKRHSALKVIREEEIVELVAAGTLGTRTGANQACTLQRAGATRWGSHLRSISSLIKLFGATRTTLAELVANGPNKVQGEAKSVELDSRFQDNSLELLVLSATFDPRDNFVSFKSEDVCNLALKFYSEDFTSSDMYALDMECGLIFLVLTLPVSTATTERAFSSMNIIKNRLRNKMEYDFLDDLIVLYIEKDFADSIDNDSMITEFEVSGPRRVRFR
ncbi:uncharacterized protein LOC112194124 [Rosa chinensis]|uniref:uncharacterized protein LOC112194124 n=1 Tax=Rosa chinensis TaxID=74649 RepID=UPI000D097D7C|nr:uncharacterized protein LOC112194124 [Rosa chinensis]